MLARTLKNARNAVGKRTMATIPSYATLDPDAISGSNPCKICNLEGGEWRDTKEYFTIPDPMNGEPFILVPNTSVEELEPFRRNAEACPKSGLHNPLKIPERFVMCGEIMHQAGHELSRPDTMDFFAKCIQRCMPKSYQQAWYEVKVTADFLKNFGGDNPRLMQAANKWPETGKDNAPRTGDGLLDLYALLRPSTFHWKFQCCSLVAH